MSASSDGSENSLKIGNGDEILISNRNTDCEAEKEACSPNAHRDGSEVVGQFLQSIMPQNTKCLKHGCAVQGNSKMLVCKECKLSVHFLCSGLPGSHIYLYLSKKGYRKYVCDGCIGEIPAEYQVENDQVNQLQDRVIKLERELKVYKELYEKVVIQKRKIEMENISLGERLNYVPEQANRTEQSTQVELPIHADLGKCWRRL